MPSSGMEAAAKFFWLCFIACVVGIVPCSSVAPKPLCQCL